MRNTLIDYFKESAPMEDHSNAHPSSHLTEEQYTWLMTYVFKDDYSLKPEATIRLMKNFNLIQKSESGPTSSHIDKTDLLLKALRSGYQGYVSHILEAEPNWLADILTDLTDSDKKHLALICCENKFQDIALSTPETISVGLDKAQAFTKISVRYTQMDNIDLGEKLLHQAEDIANNLPLPEERSQAFRELSQAQYSLRQAEAGMQSIRQAIQAVFMIESPNKKIEHFKPIIEFLLSKEESVVAHNLVKLTLSATKSISSVTDRIDTYLELGVHFRDKGEQELFEQTISHALDSGERIISMDDQMDYYTPLFLTMGLIDEVDHGFKILDHAITRMCYKALDHYPISTVDGNSENGENENIADMFVEIIFHFVQDHGFFEAGLIDAGLNIMNLSIHAAKRSASKPDKWTVDILNEISDFLKNEAEILFAAGDATQGKKVIELGIQAAEKSKTPKDRAKALQSIGQLLFHNNEPDLAEKTLEMATIAAKEISPDGNDVKAEIMAKISETHFKNNHSSTALEAIDSAINAAKHIKQSDHTPTLHNRGSDSSQLKAKRYAKICQILFSNEQPQKADKVLQLAMAAIDDIVEPQQQVLKIHFLSEALIKIGQPDKAIQVLELINRENFILD